MHPEPAIPLAAWCFRPSEILRGRSAVTARSLRGYVRGRYRDRALAALQGEYRSPVRRRLGGVLFAGVGTVAPSLHRLGSGRLLPTHGVGVRLELDPQQRTSVRADYGRGIDGASGLYLGFNQAF